MKTRNDNEEMGFNFVEQAKAKLSPEKIDSLINAFLRSEIKTAIRQARQRAEGYSEDVDMSKVLGDIAERLQRGMTQPNAGEFYDACVSAGIDPRSRKTTSVAVCDTIEHVYQYLGR